METEKEQGEEETDPYKIAPAEAYNDWNYTLDEENGIITLNYYIGLDYANPKKDVIVYANYVIDGKTYKTQIKSNDENATNKTPYMFNNELKYAQFTETIKFCDGIDMSNITNMSFMFYGCSKLTDIDFGANFNTSNVTNMACIFSNCSKLVNLDVSNFDTSNVTNMNQMFNNCWVLADLDLSSFDTCNVTNMNYMFYQCLVLKTIYTTEGKWSTAQATTTDMFTNCGTSTVTYK